ncbi:MAG: hypothetical protein RLZZ234_602 [Candidatus Parcubacteria bacterium]|jgi:ribosomal protein L37AE/L43A
MSERVHCPECGRFTKKKTLAELGSCQVCEDKGVEALMAEEAELDPHGPCGDNTRSRD